MWGSVCRCRCVSVWSATRCNVFTVALDRHNHDGLGQYWIKLHPITAITVTRVWSLEHILWPTLVDLCINRATNEWGSVWCSCYRTGIQYDSDTVWQWHWMTGTPIDTGTLYDRTAVRQDIVWRNRRMTELPYDRITVWQNRRMTEHRMTEPLYDRTAEWQNCCMTEPPNDRTAEWQNRRMTEPSYDRTLYDRTLYDRTAVWQNRCMKEHRMTKLLYDRIAVWQNIVWQNRRMTKPPYDRTAEWQNCCMTEPPNDRTTIWQNRRMTEPSYDRTLYDRTLYDRTPYDWTAVWQNIVWQNRCMTGHCMTEPPNDRTAVWQDIVWQNIVWEGHRMRGTPYDRAGMWQWQFMVTVCTFEWHIQYYLYIAVYVLVSLHGALEGNWIMSPADWNHAGIKEIHRGISRITSPAINNYNTDKPPARLNTQPFSPPWNSSTITRDWMTRVRLYYSKAVFTQ